MKNIFFLLLFLPNILFAQFIKEKQDNFLFSNETKQTAFNQYLEQGFQYYNIRDKDSLEYIFQKLDSILKLPTLDSSTFYQKEILEASSLTRDNKRDEGIGKLLKSEQYFKNKNDSINLGLTLFHLGIANYYVNRRLIAKEYFNEVLSLKNFVSKRLITRTHQNLGSINLEVAMSGIDKDTSLINQSIKNYKEVIAIYKDENWLIEESLATSLLAESYNQLGYFEKAIETIDLAAIKAVEAEDRNQLGFSLIKKASFLNNIKDYKEALNTINQTIPIFEKLKDFPTLSYAYNVKKKALVNLERYKEAALLGDTIFQISVKTYNTRFTDKIAEMDAKYQTKEKDQEISHQNEVIKKDGKLKSLLYFLIISIFILFILFYFWYKSKQKQKLQSELLKEKERGLSEIINAQENERKRIAKDLHDGIVQELTSLKFKLKNEFEKSPSESTNDIFSQLENSTTELRNISHQMMPTALTQLGVTEAIDDMLHKSLDPLEIKFNFETFGITERLKENIEITIYRVSQELVNNIVKHSGANEVNVQLFKSGKNIILIIEDNGKGISDNAKSDGIGLMNISSRLDTINGKVNFEASPNSGTLATVKIPFND